MKQETIDILKENGKTLEDILWCGSPKFGYFSIQDFMEVAPDVYDDGFGGQEIAKD